MERRILMKTRLRMKENIDVREDFNEMEYLLDMIT